MDYVKIKNRILWCNLLFLFGVFPLIYRKNYKDMGEIKFDFFWTVSLICVLFVLIFSAVQLLEGYKPKKPVLSVLDKAVLCYAGANIISFLFSPYKSMVLMGAQGWYMGFAPQMLFVVMYFLISRCVILKKPLINVLLISSGVVYIIGILHRLGFDPLQIYENFEPEKEILYTSTMGNVSWYSSFMSVVFPIGLYIFYSAKEKKNRIYAGIYIAIGFMAIVTQNTDSVYMALAGIFGVLFYLSFANWNKMIRFTEVIILMLASFKVMGVLELICKETAIELDLLSVWMMQGFFTTIVLVAAIVIYLFLRRINDKEKPIPQIFFWVLFWMLMVGIVATIVFIVLNTTGVLLNWFGFQTKNNYLYFNINWGHERGFLWAITTDAYKELPLVHQIFGVGPDGYRAFMYETPEWEKIFRWFNEELYFMNAHNEYLNLLFTVGVVGLTTFLGVLGTGLKRFVGFAKENPFVPVFALSIIGYACHNIFCYQQVFCTPFLFIMMGIGENLIRKQKKELPAQAE